MDTTFINDDLTSKGFAVRIISNILSRKSKSTLLLFFVNLDPAPVNPNIFKFTSLCYTKVKNKEPHSRNDLPQYHRCQVDGHTMTYFNHDPRCVRYSQTHLSEFCKKSKSLRLALFVGKLTLLTIKSESNIKYYCNQETLNSKTLLKTTTTNTQPNLPTVMLTSSALTLVIRPFL